MDLREYEYITCRPDTFPLSLLRSIREVLSKTQSFSSTELIDKVISTGYIQPPSEYKWHGYYQVLLTNDEKKLVLHDLMSARITLDLTSDEQHYLNGYVEAISRCLYEKPISYNDHIAQHPYYDLRDISLNDFQKFLFDHDVTGEDERDSRWDADFQMWIDGDFEYVANLYIEMFSRGEELFDLYTKDQLQQGLWISMGGGLNHFTAYDLVWESNLSIDIKEKLICSMYDLYSNVFIQDPLMYTCNMWWDSFAYSFFRIDPNKNIEHQRIQNAMFATLQKILLLDSMDCQFAALHGLGHLRHPNTTIVIHEYIQKNRDSLTDDDIAYAEACITGNIM